MLERRIVASAALARPETFRIGRGLSESFAIIGRNLPLCGLLVFIFDVLPSAAFSLGSLALHEERVSEASSQIKILGLAEAVSHLALAGMLQIAVASMVMADTKRRRPTLRDCIAAAGRWMVSGTAVWLMANAALLTSWAIYWRAAVNYFQSPGHIHLPLANWILTAGAVAAAIPGLALGARWFVAAPVLERERQGILKSLGRSRDLTKGSRWSLVMFWLLTFGVLFWMTTISRHWMLPFGVSFRVLFNPLANVADSFVKAVVMAVSYVELLRIKEGGAVEDVAEIFS